MPYLQLNRVPLFCQGNPDGVKPGFGRRHRAAAEGMVESLAAAQGLRLSLHGQSGRVDWRLYASSRDPLARLGASLPEGYRHEVKDGAFVLPTYRQWVSV